MVQGVGSGRVEGAVREEEIGVWLSEAAPEDGPVDYQAKKGGEAGRWLL